MKNNKLNAVPVSKTFKEGRAEARPYNGATPKLDAESLWKQIEDVVVPHYASRSSTTWSIFTS